MILAIIIGFIHCTVSQVIKEEFPTCTSLSGLNGIISNPRRDCSHAGGCYPSGSNFCWRVQSQCKTIKMKFNKFVVEEFMSAEDRCPYDRVLISWDATFEGMISEFEYLIVAFFMV